MQQSYCISKLSSTSLQCFFFFFYSDWTTAVSCHSGLFFPCILEQVLPNIPLFHMLLLHNLSVRWKPHDLLMLMDFPCIRPDPSFPVVSSYWMWPSGPRAARHTPESWHCQSSLSRMTPHLINGLTKSHERLLLQALFTLCPSVLSFGQYGDILTGRQNFCTIHTTPVSIPEPSHGDPGWHQVI